MKNLKTYLLALPLLLGFLLTAPVQAAAINWTLSGVTFDDGGTASGIFSTDSVTGSLLSWDVTTTGSSGNHYLSGAAGDGHIDLVNGFELLDTDLIFAFPPSLPSLRSYQFRFEFLNPLNFPGGNPIVAGMEGGRTTLSGIATSVSAVPEPETYAMMLAGLGLLGFAARRRKQAQAA